MKRLVIYVHGKGGSAEEAEHYKPLFSGDDVIGFAYHSVTPWEAKKEFSHFFDSYKKEYETILLIANSIGAYFAMNALSEEQIDRALFISPIVNMERLITDMMMWANVTEEELCRKKEISTEFGETLSWEYLCYVREHPITWNVPTDILYGEKDHLTSMKTISGFSNQTGASLTVMKSGEHWFHTEEQMEFLDHWIRETMSIEAARAGFEESFKEAEFYNKQTQDEKHLNEILGMLEF